MLALIQILDIKKTLYILESDAKRIKSVIESLSEEISKSARKEELAILNRQYKMFEPLEYIRIQDLDKLLDEKIKNHRHKELHKAWQCLDGQAGLKEKFH